MDSNLALASNTPHAGGTEPHFAIKTEVHGPGIFPQHQHDHFEMLLILSGERVQHIGLNDIEAAEGHILFMPPGVPHGATLRSDSVSLLLSFSLSFLHPELGSDAARAWDRRATLDAAPELLPFMAQSYLHFSCDATQGHRLRNMAQQLMLRSGTQIIGVRAYARSQLSILLLEVVHFFEEEIVPLTEMHRPAPNHESVDNLLTFIRAHLERPVSIEDAARHMHISPSCLTARIKRLTGKTFGDLLAEARLMRAKEMLIYGDSRISDIAYACGFDDHAYFSRRFRQFLGMSPGDYRRMAGGMSVPHVRN